MPDWNQVQTTALAYGVVALGCGVVLAILWLLAPRYRSRWLPLPRLSVGSWTGLDVLLVFLSLEATRAVTVLLGNGLRIFEPLIDPSLPDSMRERHVELLISPFTFFLALSVLVTLMHQRTRTYPSHFGLSRARWPANVAVGILVFLAVTPVVLALGEISLWLLPSREHVFVRLVREHFPAWEWWLLAFAALVGAPILEEIAYRGILMGWLRRASLAGHVALMLATLMFSQNDVTQPSEQEATWLARNFNGSAFATLLLVGYVFALFYLYRRYLPAGADPHWWNAERPEWAFEPGESAVVVDLSEESWRRWHQKNAKLAVYGSAMLFAAAHSAHWPNPIPLFFFGLAVGWLALRTQNLVGPIVVHALFNAVSFLALYWLTP